MLHFLRRIRRSLIELGSARKYLLYAVGEIALVVIGILIALQINNWNEEEKKKQLEIDLLNNFVIEMKQNQVILEESLQWHVIDDTSSHNLRFKWDQLNNDQIIRNFENLKSFWTTDLLSGVVKSIITEYGLSIISDETIVNFIASWEDKVNDIYENEELDAHLVQDFLWPLMYKTVSLDIVDQYLSTDPENRKSILNNSIVIDEIENFINSKEFNGLILQRARNMNWGLGEIRTLKEEIGEIINKAESSIQALS